MAAKNKLIVNYLPQNFNDKQLYAMFGSFGAIESANVVMDKKTGYSFGYAFVTFKEKESGAIAIRELNGKMMHGKRIKVSWSRDPGEKETNLYVTNLPREIQVEDLEIIFGPYGNIVQRAVLFDKYTQMPRGVAFVRFSKNEEAQAAMAALNGKPLDGCYEPITIKVAEDHSKRKAAYYTGIKVGQRMARGPGNHPRLMQQPMPMPTNFPGPGFYRPSF